MRPYFALTVGIIILLVACEKPVTTAAYESEPIQRTGFEGYRGWHIVNPDPLILPPQVSAMCRQLTNAEMTEMFGPHALKWFTVYVNDFGKERMLGGGNELFPVGTTILKEKLATKNSDHPELLTAMVKRESGFSPEIGDWEFLVLTGDAMKIVERGAPKHCVSCHTAVKDNDFVFANYLPETGTVIDRGR